MANYRLSRWPYSRSIAKEVDTLQRRVLSGCLFVPFLAWETGETFLRRRNRLVGDACTRLGRCSQRWQYLCIGWMGHCLRTIPTSGASWCAALLKWRGSDYLTRVRSQHPHHRTGTRVSSGYVPMRLEDGHRVAEAEIASRRRT